MPTISRREWMDAWEKDLVQSAAARRSQARVGARVSARVSSSRYYGNEATARIPKPAPELPRRKPLTEVKSTSTRKRIWPLIVATVMVCALLLSAVFVIPVLVNSSTTDLEAATGRLQTKQQQLTQAGTDLSAQVSSLSSPVRIAEEASKLGLKPATSVRYLQLGTGTVVAEGETTVASR